jgi:hypothetical protein
VAKLAAMAAFTAVAGLAIFVGSVISVLGLVVRPTYVSFSSKSSGRRWRWHISYCWVPLVGTLAMMATTVLSPTEVGQAMRGTAAIQPYGEASVLTQTLQSQVCRWYGWLTTGLGGPVLCALPAHDLPLIPPTDAEHLPFAFLASSGAAVPEQHAHGLASWMLNPCTWDSAC